VSPGVGNWVQSLTGCFQGEKGEEGEEGEEGKAFHTSALSVLNALTRCPLMTSLKQLELRNQATLPFSSTTNVPRHVNSDGSPNR